MKRLILIMVCLLVIVPVVGQDDGGAECDVSSVADVLEMAADALRDGDDPVDVFDDVLMSISQINVDCYGLSFNSDDEGQQPLLGPFTVDEGLYRVSINTSGFVTLRGTVIDGDCDLPMGNMLFNESRGQAQPAEILLESDGCELILEFDNTTNDWTLEFEKLR